MFYVDSQRTLTRRDSSLVVTRDLYDDAYTDGDILSTARAQSMGKISETASMTITRACGSTRNELVTLMFEAMLDSIVHTWEVIAPVKKEDSVPLSGNWEFGKTPSDVTVSKKRRKSAAKTKSKSRSKMTLDPLQTDPLMQSWWSGPDERAVIHFKNGNMYEGNISMKSMHGEGRFQWADGTVYLVRSSHNYSHTENLERGLFKDNEINGKGRITWKDDTWYEGDFNGNLRHGHGLYVDSRRQRSYTGDWHCGTKHGKGVIYYSSFHDSYDGDWIRNVRDGYGSREYDAQSGYKGEWDKYIREGNGLMIWPNHDFYRGHWKNGVMSGFGIYIWGAYYNNSMSFPSISAYRGQWHKGERKGYGILNLGLGLGSHYKGEFKNNKKHGNGKLVTNNGQILQHKQLFTDDNLGSIDLNGSSTDTTRQPLLYKFDICDNNVGLQYHIKHAYNNIDKQSEIRESLINDYIENNKSFVAAYRKIDASEHETDVVPLEDLTEFEKTSLHKALKCYEINLKCIYYKYSTICNTEDINFVPVMIRLYMWQFYNDCSMHERGINLIEIDRMCSHNPEWLSQSAHDPFEKIYYWQFLQSLISVAMKLYASKHLPSVKPDTILANAFRTFMEKDVLPGVGRCRGRLANGYGSFVPLKAAYELYRDIGEPHTVRTFMCAVRRPPHESNLLQPALVEASENTNIQIGRNLYMVGDELTYIMDDNVKEQDKARIEDDPRSLLKLYNFGNLSSKSIITIFTYIFPHMVVNDTIIDMTVELTFYEFFEALVACAEESIRVKEEELRWRTKFASSNGPPPISPNRSPNSPIKSQKQ